MRRTRGIDKSGWKAWLRIRAESHARLMKLAIDLEVPAEEVLDNILSVRLGMKPAREITIPVMTAPGTTSKRGR